MKNLLRIAALVIGIAALSAPAVAQNAALNNWAPVGGPAALSVTNATGNVALPSIGPTALVCNKGSADVFVKLGAANTVTAAVTDYWIKSSKCQIYNLKPFGVQFTYLAAITASSTATLYIETGYGTPLSPQ